jgi:carotenoid isomerooxygenase
MFMQDMQQNPDYASAFKSKPVRFVLPLKPDRTCDSLIQLQGTKAEACYLPNGEIFVKPEALSDLSCETPRINYDKYLGTASWYYLTVTAVIVF